MAAVSDINRDRGRLDELAPPLRAMADLFVDEVARSTALAGSTMTRSDVLALIERDAVVAGSTLNENVLVADYGEAARIVRAAASTRGGRSFVATGEIAALHAAATRRELVARPGRWRERTARPLPSGSVPPPAWLVPREVAAFVDRFAAGPPRETAAIVWAADAHARFLRIRPFDVANGRTARLVTNLLLRRTALPPLVIRPKSEARYVHALRLADARDPWPLALVFAESLLDAMGRLLPIVDDELRPLAAFATGARRATLYKAAQRGRLRVVRQRNGVFTRAEWIAEYEARRASPA